MNSENIEQKEELFLFSSGFPYGNSEPFLESEVKVMTNYFHKVHIFPSIKNSVKCAIPDNFIVHDDLLAAEKKVTPKTFLKNFFLITRVLFTEYLKTNKKKYFLNNIRDYNSVLCQAIAKSDIIKEKYLKSKLRPILFYSYWMDEGALICAILKKKNKISDFVCRVHGYDIYEERWEGNYIPFRYFIIQQSSKIYTVSQFGNKYLKSKNIFPEKVINSYLGVFAKGENPFNPNEIFTIVSCSSLIPLKRVHLIIETLKHLNFPVKWVHFGGGALLEEISNQAKSLPSHVKYELMGSVSNEELMSFYQNNSVNLFILLSETEGLSFVLQEAASFGIPLLSTNAGGNGEIVSDKTGILVDIDCPSKKIASLITEFRSSSKNTAEFRKEVKKFWCANFNAASTHKKFFENLVDSMKKDNSKITS